MLLPAPPCGVLGTRGTFLSRTILESSTLLVWMLSFAQPCSCLPHLVESLAPSSLLSFRMCLGTSSTFLPALHPSPSGRRRTQRPWPTTPRTTSPTGWWIPTARTQRGFH